jgi:hypothetical protein
MDAAATRVANRFIALQEARRVAATPVPRRARRDKAAARVRRELTPEVLAAFAEAVVDNPQVKTASMGRKLKVLWDAFQSVPGQWDAFKKLVGVKSDSLMGVVRELPGKIKAMYRQAKTWLAKAGKKIIASNPVLRLYVDVGLGTGWRQPCGTCLPPSRTPSIASAPRQRASPAGWTTTWPNTRS